MPPSHHHKASLKETLSYHVLFIPCPFPEDLEGLSCVKHPRGRKHNLELKNALRTTTENRDFFHYLKYTYPKPVEGIHS